MEQNFHREMLTPPRNWMLESILVTIFCCFPFGLAGIIFANRVNAKFSAGDEAGALRASREAGKWAGIGFWTGLSIVIIYIVAVFAFGLTAFWAGGGKNG